MFEPLADLERHAAARPHDLAVVSPDRSYTFVALRERSHAVAAWLGATGLGPGSTVGVDLPASLEWVVDLALFRLGARSVSLRAVQNPGDLRVDALITDPGKRAAPAGSVFELDGPFIDSLPAAAIEPRDFADSIFRLLLTSGTTGTPRAAAYSVNAMRYRLETGHVHWTTERPELTMIGLSTTGGFHAALACLQLGVRFVSIDRIDEPSLRFVAEQGIEVLCGSPTQVAHAVHVMLEHGITLPTLQQVRLAGAGPSDALLRLLTDTFGVPVVGVYGSTEGGGVSQLVLEPGGDRFAVGTPLPGVELEVVDGLVRYRTPGMVDGYLVDGVVETLPDGWFVPGDLGTLDADGSLTLGGRDSELINLGGVKIDPLRIDELALGFAGVRDAAAFAVERRPGIAEVGLAVVVDDGCDLRLLDQLLRQRMAVGHPTAFWRIDEIPRGRLGKALRAQLAADFADRN